VAVADAERLFEGWIYSLRARNLSENTIRSYRTAVSRLLDFTGGELPDRHGVRAFLSDQLQRHAPATAVARHRGLKSFFSWCVAEGELEASPVDGIPEPVVPEQQISVLSEDEVDGMLEACAGRGFFRVRDRALLRFFLSSGCRLEELAKLTLDDVDLKDSCARVLGKGRRPRLVGLSPGAVEALTDYLPLRLLRSGQPTGALWWGKDGPLTTAGVYKVVKRIGERAGVEVHPHAFRHLFAHRWLDAQGGEQALMTVAGWRSSKMLARYGRGLASERALRAHERLAINW
jgi:site-specific recombinase XerD